MDYVIEGIDLMEVVRRGSFVLEGILVLYVGKLARDAVLMARGYKVTEILTVQDNPAAAIDLCGYLLGLVVAVLGSLVVSSDSWLGQASDIGLTGLMVIGCLLVSSWIADKLIFRGIDDHAAINEDRNVALALGRAGAAVATGLVIRGALGPDASWSDCVIWVAFGQVAMVVICLLYQWLTPYDDLAEIRAGNIAAALPIAGILVAVGLTVEAGIAGEVEHWGEDLLAVSAYLAISMVLLYGLRVLTDLFLMPGTRLAKEIAEDKNAGAGLVEATSFVAGALILAFFLN